MQKIIDGLREFHRRYYCQNQELFEELAEGQRPRVLFVTCSDSRIDPNLITGTEPGEIFVIRNAGNIVPPNGSPAASGEAASIEYGLKALGAKYIIVCGHTHCGAMKGLFKLEKLARDMPNVHSWLQFSAPIRTLLESRYRDRPVEELAELAVAENVLRQLDNLRSYPAIAAAEQRGDVELHGWVYNIETGDVDTYDRQRGEFVPLLPDLPSCDLPTATLAATNSNHPFPSWLPAAQQERIYRGATKH